MVTGADIAAASEVARAIANTRGGFLVDQFNALEPIRAHENETGAEILKQYRGPIDAWVAGVGTGATFMGVSRALKRARLKTACYVVEPASSRPLAGCAISDGRHLLQGTGYGAIPPHWNGDAGRWDACGQRCRRQALAASAGRVRRAVCWLFGRRERLRGVGTARVGCPRQGRRRCHHLVRQRVEVLICYTALAGLVSLLALGCSDDLRILFFFQFCFNAGFWRLVWKARFFGTIDGRGCASLCRAGARASVVRAAMAGGFSMRCCSWRVQVGAGVICRRIGLAPIRLQNGAITAGSRKG